MLFRSCGVGREQDWGSHHLEHELSALYDCAHGAGLAVILPAWMKFAMEHHEIDKFVQFAVRVWGCEMDFENPRATAEESIRRFEEFLKTIGMPTRMGELGAKEEDIPILVKNMFHNKPNHGAFVKLSEEDAAEIFRLGF